MSRVVLITGCSTGIGLTTAVAFGRRGDRVYATMRTPERGGDLRRIVEEEALDVEVLPLDVTDDESVRSAVGSIVERHGRVDVIVNNAGVGPFAPIERSTDAEWFATLDTNLIGPVRVTRAALPSMRSNGSGVIVTISSVAGRLSPAPTQGAYAASKHALCALTDSINVECAPFGIRAVCIEPGFFATAIMDKDTVAFLEDDDPYKPVMEGVEQFFRASLAEAPPPDAVAAMVLAAADGSLPDGTHHVVGMDGLRATATAGRS